jgi:tRNA (guanine37-N1)-methyltransferase
MTLRFDVITLFPEIFQPVFEVGVTGRALSRGLAELHTHQLRDFAHDAYKTIDDRPYGGGPGMVMMAGPLTEAVDFVKGQQRAAGRTPGPVVLLSPSGRPIDQALINQVSGTVPGTVPDTAVSDTCWTLVCGRYEGVDQRFIDQQVDALWSLGDFVLSGGEIAAMAVIDAAIRRLPGALNDPESAAQESFAEPGLLDWPHYTRPEVFEGARVPDVLLSGHHERIADWRRRAAFEATARLRPDLLQKPKT